VVSLLEKAARGLDLVFYLISCRKTEKSVYTQYNSESDEDYYDYDVLDGSSWEAIDDESEEKQTWFSSNGKKLDFQGRFKMDYLLDEHFMFLRKNPGQEFWPNKEDEDFHHEKGFGLYRTSKFCKDMLLVFPKKNMFKILLYNSDIDFALRSIKKFSDFHHEKGSTF
jgi:hypothetical protein